MVELADDYALAYLAVMGDVHVVHEETVVANDREAFMSGSMDSGILAHGNAVANHNASGFVLVGKILRLQSDARTGEDIAVFADCRNAVNNGMGTYLGAGTYPDVRTYHGIRTDLSRIINLCTIGNDRCAVNCHRHRRDLLLIFSLRLDSTRLTPSLR